MKKCVSLCPPPSSLGTLTAQAFENKIIKLITSSWLRGTSKAEAAGNRITNELLLTSREVQVAHAVKFLEKSIQCSCTVQKGGRRRQHHLTSLWWCCFPLFVGVVPVAPLGWCCLLLHPFCGVPPSSSYFVLRKYKINKNRQERKSHKGKGKAALPKRRLSPPPFFLLFSIPCRSSPFGAPEKRVQFQTSCWPIFTSLQVFDMGRKRPRTKQLITCSWLPEGQRRRRREMKNN